MANLITNPGFETDTSDPPDQWENFNSPANVTRGAQSAVKHSGNNSWKVATTDGDTADCGLDQNEGSGHKIDILPNTEYYFSCYIKTALTTGQAHVHMKLFTAGYASETGFDTADVTGTTDWILNDHTFTSGASDVIAEPWLCFGAYGGAANGEAWFDDLYLDVTAQPEVVLGHKGLLGVGK